jgi:uncharacterized protein YydD (DUF2326 family)
MNKTPEYWERMDLDYSNKMKEIYNKTFSGELKEKFDEFTNNMMTGEAVIERNKLLDLIDMFRANNDALVNENACMWTPLSDSAFNYRPYQPCVVM